MGSFFVYLLFPLPLLILTHSLSYPFSQPSAIHRSKARRSLYPRHHVHQNHALVATMIPSFAYFRVLLILILLQTVFASNDNDNLNKRSRYRARSDTTLQARSLVTRAAPSGWALHIKSGNDGGGCYIDSAARVFTGYSGSSSINSLDSCLNTCKTKGFKYGGVENGNQCFVSHTFRLVHTDL